MSSYGSPSYWAQVMFGTHLGDQIVEQKLEAENPRLFSAVTSDSKTRVVTVKLVNASSVAQTVKIDLGAGAKVKGVAAVTTLSGKTTQETNSITDPKRIVPVVSSIANVAARFEHVVPKYSIQVIEIGVE
jgi:alpha-N-arabinofuranosidase